MPPKQQPKKKKTQTIARGRAVPFRGDAWYSNTRLSINSFMPRRLTSVFRQVMVGYYNTATARASGCFSVCVSSFTTPFNTSNSLGNTGANKSNITLNGAYSTSQNPIGYAEVNVLYTYFKVRRVRMVVKAIAQADVFYMSLYPNEAQLTTDNPVTASSQPMSKSQLVAWGSRPTTMTIDSTIPEILGFSAQQWEGMAPTLMSATPGSTSQAFMNFEWNTASGSNPGSQIYFEFQLFQEVEFSELQTFNS